MIDSHVRNLVQPQAPDTIISKLNTGPTALITIQNHALCMYLRMGCALGSLEKLPLLKQQCMRPGSEFYQKIRTYKTISSVRILLLS